MPKVHSISTREVHIWILNFEPENKYKLFWFGFQQFVLIRAPIFQNKLAESVQKRTLPYAQRESENLDLDCYITMRSI